VASKLYPKYKQAQLEKATDSVAWLTDDIRAILIDTADYTYDDAHDFLDDVAAGAREEVSAALGTKTSTSGIADCADWTWSAAAGDPCEAIIIYKHTGADATARLIAYIDNWTGLPVTLTGSDVIAAVHATGLFEL
jgi:hypothetical protein